MPLLPRMRRRTTTVEAKLREQLDISRSQETLLQENLLHQIELTLAGDEDWRRMGMSMRMDFTRAGLDTLVDISRAMYLSNPLIQRAVNVTTYYTWAQGYNFKAEEERVQQEVVDPQLANEGNRLELYSHQATLLTDVDQIVDGNVFLALFTSDLGDLQVRSIPTEQIREIICSREDYQQVLFYRRSWSQQHFDETTGRTNWESYDVLYPDIRHQPSVKPGTIGGTEVRWDAPVMHQRTGGLKHQQFGIPQTYAALDWARAHKKFLEDWHTVVSSLARFAWRASVKGTKASRLRDRLRRTGSEMEEDTGPEPGDRRPPTAGAVWADTADLTPISKSGATTSAEDAKQSRLMVGAAMDLPDTILSSDPQQGALATAKTLDRPTELGMRSRQMLYNDLHARLFRYTVDSKIRRGQLPGRTVRTADGTVVEPGIDPSVKMVFPPILEHDIKDQVLAIVSAATLDGKVDAGTLPRDEVGRQLMSALGVEDIQGALDDLATEDRTQVEQAVEKLATALAGVNGDGG